MARDLMSDKEWAFFAPFVIETGPKRGRPPKDHRRVLDGVFWIARTGSPWRDLPDSFGPWASVYRQFRRWTLAGVWDVILEALNEAEGSPNSVQMIDSTIARAHHCAAGARGDSGSGSWPFARWPHDQGPSPDERRGSAHSHRDHRLSGVSAHETPELIW